MLGPAVPLFAQHLKSSLAAIGLLVALQGGGSMLADIPIGCFASRSGGRCGMAAGLAASVLAGLLLGVS